MPGVTVWPRIKRERNVEERLMRVALLYGGENIMACVMAGNRLYGDGGIKLC